MHGERQAPVGEVEPGWLRATHQQIEQTPQLRKLAVATLAVWTAGVLTAGIEEVNRHECEETDIACQLVQDDLPIPHAMRLGPVGAEDATLPLETTTTTALQPETTTTLTPETTLPPTTTTETPPPAPIQLEITAVAPAGSEIEPRVEAAIDAVTLTPEGYQEFLNTIDLSYYDYAQQFPEFNPNHNGVSQNPADTDYATWHFTVIDMEVPDLVRTVATRGDDNSPPNHTCCGFNNTIDNDPNSTFYQLAPWEAHLSHNPPEDHKQVGTEIMAETQADITTPQYEKLSYWTLAVAKLKGWLGVRPMADYAKGHGEVRDVYKANNPHSRLGHRDDFNADVAERLRQEIMEDLNAYPEMMDVQPTLR